MREAGRFGATLVLTWPDGEEQYLHGLRRPDHQLRQAPLRAADLARPGLERLGYIPGDDERPIGFYDGVACSVIGNMRPLEFNDLTDDIAVSVFQFVVVNRGLPNAQVRIVGRLPAAPTSAERRYDPFDWNHDGNGSGMDEDAARFDSGWDNVRGYVFRGNHRMNFGAPMDCLGSAFSTAKWRECWTSATARPRAQD